MAETFIKNILLFCIEEIQTTFYYFRIHMDGYVIHIFISTCGNSILTVTKTVVIRARLICCFI